MLCNILQKKRMSSLNFCELHSFPGKRDTEILFITNILANELKLVFSLFVHNNRGVMSTIYFIFTSF